MNRNIVPIYADENDEQLVEYMSAGKEAAFNELYSRYSQKMFSYFFRMLWNNRQLAEDLTQELFVKLYRNARDFDSSRSFSTWIYSIANNMCKNEYRKASNKEKHDQQLKTIETIFPVNELDLQKFRKAVHDCMNDLQEEKRSLFILRFQEHLSIPEISSIMNIPEGTIKSRLFYLLKEMKGKLMEFQSLSKTL